MPHPHYNYLEEKYMKKIVALIAIILVVAGIAAFILIAKPFEKPEPATPTGPANPSSPTEPSSPTDPSANTDPSAGPNTDPTQPTDPIVYEITEDAVRNHPVTPESDFTYRSENGGIVITGYKGTDNIVVIPEEINGSPVRSIFRGAFDNGSTAKGLYIPSSIHVMDTAAFMNNQVLEVVVWDGSQQIGSDAFCGCSNLRLLVLGEDTFMVGAYAFYGCFELTIKVVPGSYMETYCKDHNLAYTTE